MPTPYEKIYENFLPKLQSYDIPAMTEDEVKDCLHDYLILAVSRFHACKKDLNDRDDILQRFNVELSDVEIDIISNYMIIEYIDSNYIRVPTLLKASLSSSDFNAFSNANLLSKLNEMQKRFISENEKTISRYAWIKGKNNGEHLFDNGYKKKNIFYDIK